jgi:hypothetical protein
MKLVARWVLFLSMGCLVAAQTVVDDPVMKARSQRAAAQGIQEDDLPPVPRSVMEPPPLPPPEIHAKDLPQPKATRPAKRGKVSSKRATAKPGKRGKAAAGVPGGKRVRSAAPGAKAVSPANRAARKVVRKGKA